jgi:cytochrome c-type biogenesis protein CcmH/NrfF
MGPKGCGQVLLKCTHNNCEASRRMRRELSAALQKGDSDDMVLDSFVKEYGTSVLVVPRMSDVPTRLWVLVFGVLIALAAVIVVAFGGNGIRAPQW